MSQINVEHPQYKRVKLLGEGSYGKAYLVKCLSDDSYCVVKQIDISNMSEKEKKETYNEAKVLKSMNHPNIVHFREVYKTKRGKLCIVMDFADGGDLSAKIKAQHGRYFSEAQILDWFTQICLGLKHVHDRKILHRDIKSQNIFLTKTNIVKLGDFGIAKVLTGTQELAMTVIGTPYYLSPELIDGKPYNFKSDIWSLGVLLYELCTLKHPFDANGFPMLARKISKGRYTPIPATFSKDLKELVNSLLSVDPHDRPSINAILKKDVVQNRIKKFLDETVRVEEFSHTILHHQHIVLDHVQLKNNGPQNHPKIVFTPTEGKNQKQSPVSQNELSEQQPILIKPVIHHRKPIVHTPLEFVPVTNAPISQARSPTANVRVVKPASVSKLREKKLGLPSLHSPQLDSFGRSPRSMSGMDHILPLVDNKSRPNPELPPLITNSGLLPKESPIISGQVSSSKISFSDAVNSANRGFHLQSPDAHLPNVNKRRFIPQPKSAQSKENLKNLDNITPSSRVGQKRDLLKGLDKIAPAIHVEEQKKSNKIEGKKLDFDLMNEHNHEVPKRNSKELKDIHAMVSELNQVIMNLDVEHNHHQNDIDHHHHHNLKYETEKDVDRDDDPDHENEEELMMIPPVPLQIKKENSQYNADNQGLRELGEILTNALGVDKFFKAYKLAKEMVENDTDIHLMEEGIEYHVKVFYFLTKEEVSKHLFDVFTYVVAEDWIQTKSFIKP